jgi:hypothetical protein
MDEHMHMGGAPDGAARPDRPAGHGMLVAGLDTVFFYHLPMFMSPHDYQVILEGTLAQKGSDPQRAYRDDRTSHVKTRVYTFAPDAFVLPDVFPPALKLKKIGGDLFRGHFESPPEYPDAPVPVGSGVDVNITNVVFTQKLLPLPAPLAGLEYLLFGKGKELFLAHLLTKKGDFDQVVSAEISGHQFLDGELQHGIRVQFTGRTNTAAQRLVEGKTVSASAQVSDKKIPLEITPIMEFYKSERDLT